MKAKRVFRAVLSVVGFLLLGASGFLALFLVWGVWSSYWRGDGLGATVAFVYLVVAGIFVFTGWRLYERNRRS